jgi:phosphoglycerate dehydrogenase-like enzyme
MMHRSPCARRLAQAADGRGQGAPGGIGATASGKVKLKPGDTIGILGGGQLGRMLAMAAARLGLKCRCFRRTRICPLSTWC